MKGFESVCMCRICACELILHCLYVGINLSSCFCEWMDVWAPSYEGNGTPLQYSCMENPMDGGAWWAAVHGVAKSRTQLSDVTFTFHFHALEKEMATHSSVLAWRIPGMGEPGGLTSIGSHRVGHDWSDLAVADKVTEFATALEECVLWYPRQKQTFSSNYLFKMTLGF